MHMTMICLIRHGETDWNAQNRIQGRTDIPLNEKGKQQAIQCGKYLALNDWDVIISSPLKRARQTAELINENTNLPITIMDDFIERCFGDGEGLTFSERQERFPDGVIPGYESTETLILRIMSGIEKINKQYPKKKVLLVAHGAVISSILSHLSNGEIGSGKTRLLNACISNLQFMENKWMIQNYNQVDHLEK